jgi:predicted lipopolysaccharide heptosyltransferase III
LFIVDPNPGTGSSKRRGPIKRISHPYDGIRRVLIIRFRLLGDILLTTPLLEKLRRILPDARIDYLVEARFAETLAANPHIDNLLVFRVEKDKGPGMMRYIRRLVSKKYDLVIDLHGGPRSAIMTAVSRAEHRIGYCRSLRGRLAYNYRILDDGIERHSIDRGLQILEAFGVFEGSERAMPLFHVKASFAEQIAAALDIPGVKGGGRKILLIHPGSGWPFKRWRTERFAALADRMSEDHQMQVVLTEGPGEHLVEDITSRMSRRPLVLRNLGIQALGALIARADLFICHDSGPMHMASALNVPTVALFGPSKVVNWKPRSADAAVVRAKLPCCPCRQKACERPEDPCMDTISVPEVLEAAGRLLRNEGASEETKH